MDRDIEQVVARTTEALADASGFDAIVRQDVAAFDKEHPFAPDAKRREYLVSRMRQRDADRRLAITTVEREGAQLEAGLTAKITAAKDLPSSSEQLERDFRTGMALGDYLAAEQLDQAVEARVRRQFTSARDWRDIAAAYEMANEKDDKRTQRAIETMWSSYVTEVDRVAHNSVETARVLFAFIERVKAVREARVPQEWRADLAALQAARKPLERWRTTLTRASDLTERDWHRIIADGQRIAEAG